MGIFIGDRKVKALAYGGWRIKEAYLGSTKVWSKALLPWQIGRTYSAGDYVVVDAKVYKAMADVEAQDSYRPETGRWWRFVWLYIGPEPQKNSSGSDSSKPATVWVELSQYSAGDAVIYKGRRFTARIDHLASASNAPGKSNSHWL